jgi:acetyl-CoA acetyltransferase
VPNARFDKVQARLEGDEGIRFSTAEGLAKLKPVIDGGTVTFGAQTHPADGNAAIIVATPERAAEMTSDAGVQIEPLAFGLSRAELAYMPEAPIAAAKQALARANVAITDVHAINTHNPFAVNDLAFGKAMNVDVATMNNKGCSLVYGHPNAPTGLRSVIELIEELVERGGGYGLFAGCAAGDTAMAVVLRVDGRRAH